MYKGGEAGVKSIGRLLDQIEGSYLAIAKGNGMPQPAGAAAVMPYCSGHERLFARRPKGRRRAIACGFRGIFG
jgi:hypothetical protein